MAGSRDDGTVAGDRSGHPNRRPPVPESTANAISRGPEGITSGAGGFIASGEDAVNLYRLHAIHSGLGLEMKTGMKMSRGVSMLAVANQALGTNYRRKEQAHAHLTDILANAKRQYNENMGE
jgi:hypothetical protein